jgi:hypothetical protein
LSGDESTKQSLLSNKKLRLDEGKALSFLDVRKFEGELDVEALFSSNEASFSLRLLSLGLPTEVLSPRRALGGLHESSRS